MSKNTHTQIYLSNGNLKVKNCNIFSLPAFTTCKPNTACRSFCYARKAEKCYPDVLPRRKENYKLSLRDDFAANVTELLSKRKNQVTRIHESGDFYSIEYIGKWYRIASNLPNMKFYAYTKRNYLFAGETGAPPMILVKPKNLTLIWSVDGVADSIVRLNEAQKDMDWALSVGFDKACAVIGKNIRSNNLCPATADSTGKTKCHLHCHRCTNNSTKYIVFKKH